MSGPTTIGWTATYARLRGRDGVGRRFESGSPAARRSWGRHGSAPGWFQWCRRENLVSGNGGPTSVPPDVGTKFDDTGEVLQYRGNTIVCPVPNESALSRGCAALQDCISNSTAGKAFRMLPVESLHMTVFELLADARRDEDHWSDFLPTSSPIETTDRELQELLDGIEPPAEITMDIVGVSSRTGITVELQPANAAVRRCLYSYRERASERTGIRFPNHTTYPFHISLAYRLRVLDSSEAGELAAALQTGFGALGELSPVMLPQPYFRGLRRHACLPPVAPRVG